MRSPCRSPSICSLGGRSVGATSAVTLQVVTAQASRIHPPMTRCRGRRRRRCTSPAGPRPRRARTGHIPRPYSPMSMHSSGLALRNIPPPSVHPHQRNCRRGRRPCFPGRTNSPTRRQAPQNRNHQLLLPPRPSAASSARFCCMRQCCTADKANPRTSSVLIALDSFGSQVLLWVGARSSPVAPGKPVVRDQVARHARPPNLDEIVGARSPSERPTRRFSTWQSPLHAPLNPT